VKKQNKKQPKQIEFWFVSVLTETKNSRLRGPPYRECFLEIFWFVSVCFNKILFVSVISIPVRNTKTNQKKMFFGFAKQTRKQPEQIEFRFVSVQTEKKFDCFENTFYGTF
jgi:hypothetical protein